MQGSLTRGGKRLLAVVPVDDLDLLEAIEDAMAYTIDWKPSAAGANVGAANSRA